MTKQCSETLSEVLLKLPAPGCRSWSAHKKAAVVMAVRNGTVRLSEAYDTYMLSPEELASWEAAFDADGIAGLQVKRCAIHRSAGRTKAG